MKIRELASLVVSRLRGNQALPEYESFEQALSDTNGYEDAGVVQVVSRKTQILRKALSKREDQATIADRQTVQNMLVLSYLWSGRPLNILEIGGACGATYFMLDYLLPGKIGSWRVVETPSMAAAGRQLFAEEKLTFFDDLEQALANDQAPLDLLIASGVLQYLSHPMEGMNSWLKSGAGFVYLTRTVVGQGLKRSFFTKQVVTLSNHGPGPLPMEFTNKKTSQPITILPYDQLIACFKNGWATEFLFGEASDSSTRIGSTVTTTKTVGFLLRRLRGNQGI